MRQFGTRATSSTTPAASPSTRATTRSSSPTATARTSRSSTPTVSSSGPRPRASGRFSVDIAPGRHDLRGRRRRRQRSGSSTRPVPRSARSATRRRSRRAASRSTRTARCGWSAPTTAGSCTTPPTARCSGSFGSKGQQMTQLAESADVTVDSTRVYVADKAKHRIKVWTKDGTFVGAYGTSRAPATASSTTRWAWPPLARAGSWSSTPPASGSRRSPSPADEPARHRMSGRSVRTATQPTRSSPRSGRRASRSPAGSLSTTVAGVDGQPLAGHLQDRLDAGPGERPAPGRGTCTEQAQRLGRTPAGGAARSRPPPRRRRRRGRGRVTRHGDQARGVRDAGVRRRAVARPARPADRASDEPQRGQSRPTRTPCRSVCSRIRASATSRERPRSPPSGVSARRTRTSSAA